nr:MAG TPA: hypothetical protein [Caudoviricetes sp.]
MRLFLFCTKKEGYCFRNSPQCNKYKNIIITEMIFQYKK